MLKPVVAELPALCVFLMDDLCLVKREAFQDLAQIVHFLLRVLDKALEVRGPEGPNEVVQPHRQFQTSAVKRDVTSQTLTEIRRFHTRFSEGLLIRAIIKN